MDGAKCDLGGFGSASSIGRRCFVRLTAVAMASVAIAGFPGLAFANDSAIAKNDTNGSRTVDSFGRSVPHLGEWPGVIPSGGYAQSLLITLCPDRLSALAVPIDEDAASYRECGLGYLLDLPVVRELYSYGRASLDVGALRDAPPSLYVDVGFAKDDAVERLETVEAFCDVPAAFIAVRSLGLPDAYRTLGEMLGCCERAEKLASYVEGVREKVRGCGLSANDLPLKVLLAFGSDGLSCRNVAEMRAVLRLMGADSLSAFEDGWGDVSAYDADVVLFNHAEAFHDAISGNELWDKVLSLDSGSCLMASCPSLIYRWMGSSLMNQTMGALWAANAICPEPAKWDLLAEAKAFYSLFFGDGLEAAIEAVLDD